MAINQAVQVVQLQDQRASTVVGDLQFMLVTD
jgi:hypothetical protein